MQGLVVHGEGLNFFLLIQWEEIKDIYPEEWHHLIGVYKRSLSRREQTAHSILGAIILCVCAEFLMDQI